MFRFDKAIITTDSLKTTDEGYLKGSAVVTRTGIFKYLNTDGSIRKELRLPEQVFSKDSLLSLKGIPVTLEHPTEFVNAKNAKDLSVGFTGEKVQAGDSMLTVNFTITNQDAINAVNNGKRELSLGYEQDLELKSGTHNGQKYDAIQTNIKYNHLAIVDRARAGRMARINIDTYGSYAVQINDKLNKGVKMAIIQINGVDQKVDEAVAKAYNKQKETIDSEKAELEKKISQEKARADEAQEIVHKMEQTEKIRKDQEARLELIEKVAPILGKEYKFDSAEDEKIKKDSILKVFPEAELDNKEPAYLEARLDSALELLNDNKSSFEKQQQNFIPSNTNTNNDGVLGIKGKEAPTGHPDDLVEDARKKFDSVITNAWKKPAIINSAQSMDCAYKELKTVI